MTDKKNENSDTEEKKPIIIRNCTDLQRLKLEKLMQNPDKPVIIPEKPKERGMPPVPDFVRNVMGSSAGAGSGEFHVYRHLRRKEYARQKYMKEKAEKEKLEEEYHKKLEDNRRISEERTAKKRMKRLKKKQKIKSKKPRVSKKSSSEEKSEQSSDEDDEERTTENSELDKVNNSKDSIDNTYDMDNIRTQSSEKQNSEHISDNCIDKEK